LTGILDGEADVKVNGHQVPEKIPHISVVVPTYRNGDLLRRCLDALLAQRIDPEAFEVIVVDDGREDSVRDLVCGIADWIQAPRVRYLRPLHGRGAAGARNRGWRAAKGALIAFTHDDTIPDPDWLMAGVRAFENNRHWVGLSGQVVVPVADGARARSDVEHWTRPHASAEFVTANAFVWRTALEAVGGFDERFTRTWRDDSDLQFRLLKQGASVGHCDDARVVHPVREESWRVCLHQQRDTFFDALLYKKHPRLYRERIRRIPPWDYYAIVALGALVPLLLAIDWNEPAIACALCVVALVVNLAITRVQSAGQSPRHLLQTLATSALIPFLSVYWRVRGALHFRVLFL
jgi:GT2 family glycosyltransferase